MKNKFAWIITFLSFGVSAAALNFLPDRIPAHYDISGNIDRYGSKYEVFNYPLIIFLFALVYTVVAVFQKKKASFVTEEKKAEMFRNNMNVAGIAVNSIIALEFVMHLASVISKLRDFGGVSVLGEMDPFTFQMTVLSFAMGIMFIVIGNFMSKTKRNGTVGFRTNSSMKNDMTWQLSNRFAGRAMMISGIISAVLALVIKGLLSVAAEIVLVLCVTVVSSVYAAKAAEKYPEEQNCES